jgi:dUTP pyrophosphatase
MTLRIERTSLEARIPTRATPGSAGLDLYSAEDVVILPKNKSKVNVGIKVALPEGCYGRIAPRSGLAVNYFIDVGAGVIDQDFRGEIVVVLFNFSDKHFQVKKGDKIAQFIVEKILIPELVECESLSCDFTERGQSGFGSSGV